MFLFYFQILTLGCLLLWFMHPHLCAFFIQVTCSSPSTLGESLTSLVVTTSPLNSYLQFSSWPCTLLEGKVLSTLLHQHFCNSRSQSDALYDWPISSVSAGCRGGLLLCAISAFTCRIKVKVFGALTKQEISFFETVKTGKASDLKHENSVNNFI